MLASWYIKCRMRQGGFADLGIYIYLRRLNLP